ncbi:7-cyano-7-deazaguanine synthase QueC [Actinomadura atramentaria]|uniref:7-cyano-7-deazaguanine synthase QueC n=1 Tax=Actinomadura atramentaria TaxID=1990 RepID=UPI0003A22532|nr:7-cyano-7-deazaguanine synthase QueC [Actinomadura atramentaria]
MAVVSGGLDSTVLAHWLAAHAARLTLLSADYGQRHRKELEFARGVAEDLAVPHCVVDLTSVGRLLTGSALTDPSVAVPDGRYDEPSMSVTVVPHRNALLLDAAVCLATALGADTVAYGAHGGDHAVYPDCRPAFVDAYERTARLAGEGFLPPDFAVTAPFLALAKAEIVGLGDGLGVPFERTWSCYRGGGLHCGTCGTCVERREAFAAADVADPTRYATGEA